MSFLDQVGGLLNNLSGGNLSEQETHAHYDQIAQQVPQDQLGTAIGPALSNLDNSELQSRVADSAGQMSPQQKGNLVQSLLGGLGGGGAIGSILSQLGINQNVANDPQSASPEEVGKLAAHAKENNPGLFQKAMSFYSEHPTLVKALGAVAIAQIARHLANPQS